MKVLVLAGGSSNEREVSLTTGAAVCDALGRLGHSVIAFDPASGEGLLDVEGRFLKESPVPNGHSVTLTRPHALAGFLEASKFNDVDVVFIALHGGTGEDGTIQNLLDLAGLKYTGSDMTSSAAAMHKALAKHLMQSVSIPTPRWSHFMVTTIPSADAAAAEIARTFSLPFIVKPNISGSTVGLTKVEQSEQLLSALHSAAVHSPGVLVEEFIAGRELTVSVLDGQAYPIIEIQPTSGLYDYEAKYTSGKSRYLVPAPLDDALTKRLQEDATKLYETVGAAGVARVDFLLNEKNEHFCLELNTLPGMTALSLVPMSFQSVGIGFDQLVSLILESALK